MRKTKIICTLGPSSDTVDVMKSLFLAGMNVGRINFSHGTHEEQKAKIDNFRIARDQLGVAGAVLLDTKGPEIRIGNMKAGGADIVEGQEYILTSSHCIGDERQAHVQYKNFPKDVKTGTKVLLDDGKIVMHVIKSDGEKVFCRVENGGKLTDHKGINLPGVRLTMPYLSEEDKKDLALGVKLDVDFIAASFTRRRADVEKLRSYIDALGGQQIKIIAKIESREGIENFEEILQEADGIMIARGDMGVELPFERLPGIQKRIINRCLQLGKIVITATQMLESMVINPSPTRAEITDVANAVFDGTGAIMLSGETAAGKFPVAATEAMSKIAMQAERDTYMEQTNRNAGMDRSRGNLTFVDFLAQEDNWRDMDHQDVTNAVGHSACTMAFDLRAGAIMAITKTGYTATRIAKFRPITPIIAMTPYDKTFHQMAMEWGVSSLLVSYKASLEKLMGHCIDEAVKAGAVKKGDKVVITAGMPLDIPGNTNIIRVEKV